MAEFEEVATERPAGPRAMLIALAGLAGFALLGQVIHLVNFVPVPTIAGELKQAAALEKLLTTLDAEGKVLQLQQHDAANGLRIEVEEAGDKIGTTERANFNSYIDQLVTVRDKWRRIRETLAQGEYTSTMVFVIQKDALEVLGSEISRLDSWIEIAKNLGHRAELLRKSDFPEVPILRGELNSYLLAPLQDPFDEQMQEIHKEFRI